MAKQAKIEIWFNYHNKRFYKANEYTKVKTVYGNND